MVTKKEDNSFALSNREEPIRVNFLDITNISALNKIFTSAFKTKTAKRGIGNFVKSKVLKSTQY